ncbi:DUF2490 domain-containing protein [Cytophaga aurantiaca]|uniref:DUF2490 domain-containing protein n=1 Tax=Cytophaga aurantiaca TaxID=29530 RepID=UPI000363EB2C|nr:DUF2490 domain-containing protein [Cytophaga aurantiaca]
MKKLIVTVALSLSGMLCAFAQTTPSQNFADHPRAYTQRKSFWFEANISGSIDSLQRWQYQIDYQYRRMADASYIQGGNQGNIFKDPYQQVIRPWIHYWVIPQKLRFSLSPLGYWITWTPPQEGSVYKVDGQDQGQAVFPEFRICPQVTVNSQLGRLLFSNRYRYEFRLIGDRSQSTTFMDDLGAGYSFYPNPNGSGNGSSHQGRLRWQIRAQLLLNSPKMQKNTVYINAWNELFIGMGKHVDYQKMLNQNRTVALFGWKLPTQYPIRIEAGITYQVNFLYNIDQVPTQPTVSYGKRNVEANTAYTVYIIFDEFHTLFKKKGRKPQDEPKFPHPEKL